MVLLSGVTEQDDAFCHFGGSARVVACSSPWQCVAEGLSPHLLEHCGKTKPRARAEHLSVLLVIGLRLSIFSARFVIVLGPVPDLVKISYNGTVAFGCARLVFGCCSAELKSRS